METETITVEHGIGALLYPIFRDLCPELTDDEFEGMRTVVMGWMFGNLEVPEA